jgi:hypothetical protein
MIKHKTFCCNPRLVEEYYIDQVGRGLPIFMGSRVQRGHGIGSLISGLVRSAVPLIKSGVKSLGKHALKAGIGVADDVLAGKNFKESIQSRAKSSGRELIRHAIDNIKPPGELAINPTIRPIKRKRKNTKAHSKKGKRRKHQDIFD